MSAVGHETDIGMATVDVRYWGWSGPSPVACRCRLL